MSLEKEVWEGWKVQDFIDDLEIIIPFAIKGLKNREDLKKWCMSEQPYYKKYIPEVVDYFFDKYIKD